MPDRKLGDCEIRSISFERESTDLKMFDPFYESLFTISFRGVGNLVFSTNHYQNVIGGIVFFKTYQEALNHERAGALLKTIEPFCLIEPDRKHFAWIEPIAGGEAVISYESVQIIDGD
jgi:hypothetical protein